ncbi:MAG: Lrp/AsnC family transcriptional regulator [Candidatus Aenigmarchaeota archaeon]|nr:Lrp/AsnC family transcriptional regulator [Candidatus Aenigmarchaeota archaeon]
METLDEKDMEILGLLKENSKLTTQQVSKKTLIPITTVHNRIKKMENLGVIKGYALNIDHKKLGKNITAIVLLTVSYMLPDGRKISQTELAKEIRKHPGVEEVNIVTGGSDIILKVRVESVEKLNDFIISDLREIGGVDKTQTMIVLSSF